MFRVRGLVVVQCLAVLALCLPYATAAPKQPNVILINVDDMGWADIGVYDPANRIDTPNLDQLATDGIRFTNFYVNSPICSPSRCGLYTGMYPSRWRVHSYIDNTTRNANRDMVNFLSLDAPFIARMFKAAGYRTGQVGKWHLGGGRDVGYDIAPYGIYTIFEAPLIPLYGFDESYTQFEGLGDRQLYTGQGLSNTSAGLESTCCPPDAGPFTVTFDLKRYSTSHYVDRAIQFINDALANDPNQPFYLNMPLDDVHSGYDPFPDLKAKYNALYPNLPDKVRAYMAVAENMDSEIGRLIAYVDGLGLAENTLIILMADNGPESQNTSAGSTAHLRGTKRSLYEGGVREPLILRWTGTIAPNQVNDRTVIAATDLFPSLTSIVGGALPIGHAYDGVDLSPALLGKNQMLRPTPLFWEFAWNSSVGRASGIWLTPNLSMRVGDWKFLVEDNGSGPELYNLADDESETTNLANQRPDLVQTFTKALLSWRYTLPGGAAPEGTLIAHLKADSLSVGDGDPVASWTDEAGGDSFVATMSQSDSTRQPTKREGVINGLPVVEFDGGDDMSSSGANSLSTPGDGFTMFMVATGDTTGGVAKRAAQIGNSGGANLKIMGLDISSSPGSTGFRFNGGASLYSTPLETSASDFHIYVAQVANNDLLSNAVLYIDGVTPAHTFTGTSNNASGVISGLDASNLELMLGAGRSNAGAIIDRITGSIAEVLIYDDHMTVNEINLVASYLALRYDLPFEYLPPNVTPDYACLLGPELPLPEPDPNQPPPPTTGTDVLCIETANGTQIKHYHVENGVWTFESDFISGGAPRGFAQDPNTGVIWTTDLGGPIKKYDEYGVALEAQVGVHGVDYTDVPEFLELDADGNLYLPTGPGGSDRHVIRYNPHTDTWTDQFIPTTDGANYAFSNNIRDIEIVGNRFFVADKNNNRIVEFNTATGAFVQVFDDVGVPIPSAIEYDPNADRLLVSADLSGSGTRSDDIIEYRGIAGLEGQPATTESVLINQEADDFNIHGIMVLEGEVYITNLYENGSRQGIFRVDTANNEYDQIIADASATTVLNQAIIGQPTSEGCQAFDFDGDGDFDMLDLALRMQLQ